MWKDQALAKGGDITGSPVPDAFRAASSAPASELSVRALTDSEWALKGEWQAAARRVGQR